MRIRLLGPVELIGTDGQLVELGAAKRRTVLAALALELNKVVSADRLMTMAWDDNPPPSARAALQGHIAQLRKVLGNGVELITKAPGYQLVADRCMVDATRFDDLITQARTVSAADGVELLRSALALWRGPVLADVPAAQVRDQAAAWLDEARLVALQDLGEQLAQLGRITEVIADLRDAVESHPTREPLVELLMRGLFETGRQAEALRLFHQTRTALADELGVDPSSSLQQTYQLVLTGADDSFDPPVATPAQLPRQNRGLVGRDGQLAELAAGLRQSDPAVRVLTGPAGVGKTALALHSAHTLDMPDGQLFVDLKGFDDQPMDPGVVLAGFLRALGVADARIPACVTERSALYRSLLAGRRMLVLLDNAHSADQVRPLLPGASSCVVLVTSRHRLDDLIVTEGAVPLPVDVLAPDDAVTVLGMLAGRDRVAADRRAAMELADLCGRSPLALRIVAGRLMNSPQWTLRDMVVELSGKRRKPRVAVDAAVERTYRRLEPSAARQLRLLGRYGGDDIDQYAAAALTGTRTDEAWSNLDTLAAVHLLRENGRDRYGCYGLERRFMTRIAAEEPLEQLEAATVRLLDYYVQTAEQACKLLPDHIWSPQSPVEYPAAETPPMQTTADAMRWFAVESASMHRMLDLAVEQGYQERAWRLALCLARFYFRRGDLVRQLAVCGIGLTAAERLGNNEAQAVFLACNANVQLERGRVRDALRLARRATDLYSQHKVSTVYALALHTAGSAMYALGRPHGALMLLYQGHALVNDLGDRYLDALYHQEIGNVMAHLGGEHAARPHWSQAERLHEYLAS
ncbi:DNA-binding SARP family transcriptional activator [Kibdelosporangium banguiense]|uniref:DNA-binding SARP family transcriptional activator n=1 Tax=Kibdelosporangium banguiense TaxID=1365924 RepID=A0ABS4TM92_9PSEU|nr:BTAD domain-containing putative transcriptional regulator [Kibdelosporangium banguiense]MBP2325043.1 DNA-binding SARP family transcriptional activator [Kibdelosporangium banguiense]